MSSYSAIRKFALLFFLSALSFTVINCTTKDEPGGTAAGIQGSWKFTAVYTKSGNAAEVDNFDTIKAVYPCFPEIVLTFKANGLISADVPAACQTAVNNFVGDIDGSAYEVKSGQLIIIDGSANVTTMTVNFSGNQMAWIDTSTSGGTTTTNRIVLTKQ